VERPRVQPAGVVHGEARRVVGAVADQDARLGQVMREFEVNDARPDFAVALYSGYFKLKDKDELRRWALSGKESFQTLLDMIRTAGAKPYDMAGDPLGELVWKQIAAVIAEREPFVLKPPAQLNLDGVASVVAFLAERKERLSAGSGGSR